MALFAIFPVVCLDTLKQDKLQTQNRINFSIFLFCSQCSIAFAVVIFKKEIRLLN